MRSKIINSSIFVDLFDHLKLANVLKYTVIIIIYPRTSALYIITKYDRNNLLILIQQIKNNQIVKTFKKLKENTCDRLE